MTKKEIAVLDAIKASIRTKEACCTQLMQDMAAKIKGVCPDCPESIYTDHNGELQVHTIGMFFIRCNAFQIQVPMSDYGRLLTMYSHIRELRAEALELESVVGSFENLNSPQ